MHGLGYLPHLSTIGDPVLLRKKMVQYGVQFSQIDEAMALMKESYKQIIDVAEKYEIDITIEVHGYFTNNIERLGEMLHFVDSPRLMLNLDTSNSFIAGGNPVDFANRFAKKVSHVHIKDVSQELAEKARGNDTGIAMSHSATCRKRFNRDPDVTVGSSRWIPALSTRKN